jgi:F-type H+-transporting ATPase subunit j
MAFFGFRKYSTPVLRPMYPFIIGGAVTFYLVASAQKAMLQGEQHAFPSQDAQKSGPKLILYVRTVPEYRDDARNLHSELSPRARRLLARSPYCEG